MVNEKDILDFLDNKTQDSKDNQSSQIQTQTQTQTQPQIQTSQVQNKTDTTNIVNRITEEVASKLYPYLAKSLAILSHSLQYANIKDKYNDLKIEDYIKINDELEKELGEVKSENVSELLERFYSKRKKILDKIEQSKKEKEEVKKTVSEVDVDTNASPILNKGEKVKTNVAENNPVVEVFNKLNSWRNITSTLK